MEYKKEYGSFDMGMSFFNNRRYDIMNMGLENLLEGLGLGDLKVVCMETISRNEYMPEKERFKVIIGKKDADWEKILEEN